MLDKNKSFNNIFPKFVIPITTLTFLFWAFLLTYKYINFGYTDWDFALYAQTMWDLRHGSVQVSLFGTNFLANHSNYIAFLLAPIYFIFNHPLTLIYLKLLAFFAGALVFYKISEKMIGGGLAFIFMLIYLIHPPNIYMLFFEFDFESLAIVFIFLMFYFYQQKSLKSFLICCFLASLIKENIPLIVIMFGIYALLDRSRRNKVWALAPILIGGAIFTLTMFIMTPMIRQGLPQSQNIYLNYYTQTFFPNPQSILNKLFIPENGIYVRELFGPLLSLAIFSPQILMIGASVFFQNILGGAHNQHTIFFHYAATFVPFIFLACVTTTKFLLTFKKKNIVYLTMAIIIIFQMMYVAPHINECSRKVFFFADRLDNERQYLVNEIPKDASVVATFQFLPSLSQRKNLYALYNVWLDANYFTGQQPFRIKNPVDYALIDFNDPWLRDSVIGNPQTVSGRVRHFLNDQNLNIQDGEEDIILFSRNAKSSFKLVETIPSQSLSIKKDLNLTIDGNLQLLSLNIDTAHLSSQILPITFYWQPLSEKIGHYEAILLIEKENKIYYKKRRDIGYTIYPTSIWAKEELVKETYLYAPPRLEPGEYVLAMIFIRQGTSKPVNIVLGEKTAFVENSKFKIGSLFIR